MLVPSTSSSLRVGIIPETSGCVSCLVQHHKNVKTFTETYHIHHHARQEIARNRTEGLPKFRNPFHTLPLNYYHVVSFSHLVHDS